MSFHTRGRLAMVPSLVFILNSLPVSALLAAESIIVEAPRTTLTAPDTEAARIEANRQPGGAAVISSDVYTDGRASTLVDALGYAPGVYIVPRFGNEAKLSIRGSGLQQNFHTRGVLLMSDGIPVSLADGSGDFQTVSPKLTDYLTVYRGAEGQVQGATTLGGAIDFVSPTGRTAPPLTVSAEAGSFDYARATVSGGAAHGAWDAWAGATLGKSDGFREHSAWSDGQFSGNVGYRFDEHLENRLFLGFVDSDGELPSNLTRTQLESDPRQSNPGNTINDAQHNVQVARVSDRLAWVVADQQVVTLTGGYSHKTLYHPLFFFFSGPGQTNPIGPVLDDVNHDGVGSLAYAGQLDRHHLTSLVRFNAGLTHDERYFNQGGEKGALIQEGYQRSSNTTVDVADEYEITEGTYPSFGLQFVHATRELDDHLPSAIQNTSDNSTYQQFNPRFGIRQMVTKEAQIYGNVSRSFDPPSFFELVPVGVQPGLIDLDAQSAWTAEIGSRGGYTRATWDVSMYYSWVRNELLGYQTAPFQTSTLNADDTRHVGVELGSAVVPLENLFTEDQVTVRCNYLFSWYRFVDDPVYGNNQIAGVPQNVVTAEALYGFLGGWYVGPTVQAAQASYVDLANTTETPGWAILGIKAGYRTSQGFSGWIEARNIGNVTYASAYNVVTQANPNSSIYMPGDGRAYYAGAG